MKLKALIKELDLEVKGAKESEILGLSTDSRTISPGHLFIARKGLNFNGAEFVAQAVNGGAKAILSDLYDPFLKLPQLIHPDPASLIPILASRFYGHPSKKLAVIGVTGTKGKTTTSYLIRHLLDCGLASTVETIIGKTRAPSLLTTHDAIQNQKLLKEMALHGCKAAVLEVSSHGLVQGRVDGIDFAYGLFTNLYPDHLDYHKTMEEYASAKKILFQRARKSFFNADSPWKMGEGMTFGIEKGDIRAESIVYHPTHTEFTVQGNRFHLPLIGTFNVYNALGAIALGAEMGLTFPFMKERLSTFPGVPGRLERVGNVFIDFAHTGEALDSVLETLKKIAPAKLIVVFGAGGNRDRERRVGMAKAADKWADHAVITTDNPRQEDPAEIAKQIASHFRRVQPITVLDRKKAIAEAIAHASPDDFILIAGKGHQKEQIYAHHQIPFDDVEVAKEALLHFNRILTS